TVAALGPEDVVVLDVVGHRTADATVRTDALDRLGLRARHQRQGQRLVGQGAGRAHRRAFPARHAGAGPPWLTPVEGDAGAVPLTGPADDFVRLKIVAGANAAVTQNTGGVIDGDDGRGNVLRSSVDGGWRMEDGGWRIALADPRSSIVEEPIPPSQR